jgi:hypothetical protein
MSKTPKDASLAPSTVNAELLAMTYGAVVVQLLKDYSDVALVNAELEKMGYNIGVRMVDEFFAKSVRGASICFAPHSWRLLLVARLCFRRLTSVTPRPAV